ncbi:hypothetical protein PROFUN_17126, partial [Planoprotostelium fungivorum]
GWVLRILGLAHLLTIVLLREYRRVLDLIAVRVAKRLRTLIYSIESYSTMRRSLDIPNAIILSMQRDFSSPPPDSNHPYLPPHHPKLPRPAPSCPDLYRPRPSPHNPSPYRVTHNKKGLFEAPLQEERSWATPPSLASASILYPNVMPRSFKRKGRKSSTPPAKVARTPQSSERSNLKQVEEGSPSVPSSPTLESADREVASPIGGGEDDEREDNFNQPEAEENNHPPGRNRQLFNMINSLQAMVD